MTEHFEGHRQEHRKTTVDRKQETTEQGTKKIGTSITRRNQTDNLNIITASTITEWSMHGENAGDVMKAMTKTFAAIDLGLPNKFSNSRILFFKQVFSCTLIKKMVKFYKSEFWKESLTSFPWPGHFLSSSPSM